MGLGKERANKSAILIRLFSYNIAGCILYIFLYTLFDDESPALWYILATTVVYFIGFQIVNKVPDIFSAYFFIITFFLVQNFFNFFVLPLESFNFMLLLLAPSGLILFFDIVSKPARIGITLICFATVIMLVIYGPHTTQITFDPFETKIIQLSIIGIFFSSSLVLFDLYQKELDNLEVRLVDKIELDQLTGIHTRRALFSIGQYLLKNASDKRLKSSVLIIDIDQLTKLNKSHGQEIGDLLIQHIGIYLNKAIGEPALVGRYSGEEFVVLIPEYNLEQAYALAEEIRMAIATLNIKNGAIENSDLKRLPHATVSIGVTCQYLRYESLDSLIAKAKIALLEAKKSGRNRSIRFIAEAYPPANTPT